ncbi:1-aminocyclopropane-1-carboxylate deaminase [Vibrio cholerae]|nr:1-aminocyclopropane-1-carboxylate deaminase [Vibrio cholerae]
MGDESYLREQFLMLGETSHPTTQTETCFIYTKAVYWEMKVCCRVISGSLANIPLLLEAAGSLGITRGWRVFNAYFDWGSRDIKLQCRVACCTDASETTDRDRR